MKKLVFTLFLLTLFLLGAAKIISSVEQSESEYGANYEECIENYERRICNDIYYR